MYIVYRNQSERADHSSFEDEMIPSSTAEKALAFLVPLAGVLALLAIWALLAGASPAALLVAVIFFAAIWGGRSKKNH